MGGVQQGIIPNVKKKLCFTKKFGTVSARSVVMMMSKEEAGREIEKHLQILTDYDVLNVQVAETLTEYLWSIIDKIDTVIDVNQLEEIWKKDEDGNL